ncbi:MAG: hypothetical protein KatS3mg082_2515 [Nitrospiraceae bacterium]|nr:MAG: hypothetical protein KatS3mg082_2515 [Nitrospiraceae bacterium]
MDVRDLRAHPFRHRRPLGLVVFELIVTQGRPFLVERDRQAVRPMPAENLHQHRGEAIDRVGLKALGVRQRREREEGAIDIGAAVDEIERGHVNFVDLVDLVGPVYLVDVA